MSLIIIILNCIYLIVWFLAYYPAMSEVHIFLCNTVYYIASGITYFLSVTQSFNKLLNMVYPIFVLLSL
jgi:hypothetical protein